MPLFAKPIICQECVELVTDYLDGGLSRRDRKRFEAHMSDCAACDAYLVQIRATARTLGELPDEPADPEVRAHLLATFRELRGQ